MLDVWINIFPYKLVFGRHFKNTPVYPFTNQSVSVGKPLDAADKRAVKSEIFKWRQKTSLRSRILPFDQKGYGINF